MKAVLIGTAAYKNTYNDIDIICDQEFANTLKNCTVKINDNGITYFIYGKFEATVPNPGTAYELVLNSDNKINKDITISDNIILNVKVAKLELIAALKKAHLILPKRWNHHITEYKYIKDLLNVKEFDPKQFNVNDVYRLHRKECLKLAKKHPKLNQSKESFFGSTNYEIEKSYEVFDHDSIHEAIAVDNKPAYLNMLDGEVWCNKAKWNLMSEYEKFNCVKEEASVLALERSIIPAMFLNKPFLGEQWAYETALQKICTTITSGFFRDYCIEKYWDAINDRPKIIDLFFNGIRNNIIKMVKHI